MENVTGRRVGSKIRAEKRQMRLERSAKAAKAAAKVHSAKKCATAASASAVSTPGNNASWSHEEKIDNSTAAFSVRGEHQCHESGLGAQTGNVGHGHDGIHSSSMTVESGVNVKNEKSFEEERIQKRDAPCCSQQQPVFFDNNKEEEAFVENRPCSSLALPGTPHQFDSPSPSPSINVLTDQSAGHQMDQNLDQIDENVSNDGIMEVSQENVQTTTARKGSQQPKCREKTPPRAQSETPAGHSISGIEQPANNNRSSAPPIFVEPTEAEGVMDENIGQSDDPQNDLQEQEEVEEHQQQNGEHSICAFDPVTKKLFYEPHKRPGCADIYCLSHFTQIGERVCNIENKLNQLEELFGKLIGQKSAPSTATNDNTLTSIQQQPRVVVPQNNFPIPTTVVQPRGCQPMLGNHQLQPVLIPPFPTGPRYVSRILASNLSNQLPAPRMPSLIYNPVPLPAPPKPPYQYRPRAGWPIWLSAAGEQTLSKKEPILHPIAVPFIPLKPMKYNVRIYFIKDKDRASNMCPICFAIFTEGPTGSHPHCRVYLKDGTGSIPSDHYNLHNSQIIDRRTVESYLCSFCSHGGDTYRIQFLSVAAVLQHLLNTHGMKTKDLASNTVRTLYIRARNPRAAKALLHKFVQNGLGKLVREKPDNVVEADHLQPQKKKHPRRRADSPDFLEKGDLLDKLLDCPAPCTLLERNRRLKKLERLPANNLIVNINESMIGENDFVLTGKDLDALMADKQSHRTSGKKAGSRTISRSPSRSTAVSSNECSSRKRGRGQRDRTKSCSSTASGVTIDSGQLEEDQEQEEEEEEMASTDENNGSRESSEEDEGRKGALKRKWTKGLKDPDYRSAGAESAKKAMKPSSSSAPAPSPPPTMASFQSFHNPAVPSSQDPFDMTGSIPNALPNLRPSFALIRQFGYVASKGIYGSPSKTTEETQKQSSNGAANCQR